MLIGAAVQLLLSLGVYVVVYFNWRTGYTEYYLGWALLSPVNILAFIYYVIVLLIDSRRAGL